MTWAVNQQIISLKWTTLFCAHGYTLSQALNSTPIRVHTDMPGFMCWVQASHQQHRIVNQCTLMDDFLLTLWGDIFFFFYFKFHYFFPICLLVFEHCESILHMFLTFPVTTRVQIMLFLVIVVVKWKLGLLCSCPVSKAGVFFKNEKNPINATKPVLR